MPMCFPICFPACITTTLDYPLRSIKDERTGLTGEKGDPLYKGIKDEHTGYIGEKDD